MTTEEHIHRAREFIAIAESDDPQDNAYARAADEIIAAQKAAALEGEQLTNREVARQLGRDESWVRKLVTWRTSSPRGAHPFARDSYDHERARTARKYLRDAPAEEKAEVIATLMRDEEVQKQPKVWAAVDEAASRQSPRDAKDRPMTRAEELTQEELLLSDYPDVDQQLENWLRKAEDVRLTDRTREVLLGSVEAGRLAHDAVEEYLRGGLGLAEALDRMTREGI